MVAESSPPRKRHLFIDLYRSFVILLMLQGHIFRAFLPSEIKATTAFDIHEFIHGLTAPAFLFGAGLTFVISTRRRWIEYHHWGDALARRVGRLLFVLLLGFMLHLPFLSFRKILFEGTTSTYLQLFQFDVLHCIGFGLLSLHAILFFFRDESHFYGMVLITAIAVSLLTPLVWDADFLAVAPIPIVQALTSQHGSHFPLFPFVGFLYAGVIVSWEFLVATEKQQEARFMRTLALLGALVIAFGIVLDALPIQLYPEYNFWDTSPNYFLIRVGSLMIVTAAFWYGARKLSQPKKLLTVLGRESLFVYVLHLIIIYGSVMNARTSLLKILGPNLDIVATTVMFLSVLSTMLGAALFWSYLKEKRFHVYRVIQLVGSGIFLYLFFTRDY